MVARVGQRHPLKKGSDADFLHLIETIGPAQTAQRLNLDISCVYRRRARLERALGRQIKVPNYNNNNTRHGEPKPKWLEREIEDGHVLIGSDAHFWPGIVTTAWRAFLHFGCRFKPKIVILNGDILDGATISRHAPIGWEKRPTLIQEIEFGQERLGDLKKATPDAEHIWTLGNHDARLETRVATVAPEYARIKGVHLHDHFPGYEPCWSVCLNDEVVVKHRDKGGQHATFNNTLRAGRTMVTGHLHSLRVYPFSDYNGTRFGIDCGTLAEPYGPKFQDYLEQKSVDWRSGFVLLTFRDGRLMWPEIVPVTGDGEVQFRGEVVPV